MKKGPIENKRRMVVNATPLLWNLTGVGQVALEVSRRLVCTPGFEVDFFTPLKTFSTLQALEENDLHTRILRLAKGIFHQLPFKDALRKHCLKTDKAGAFYNLYWEPNFIPVDSIRARRIVTTVYDLSVFEHPEWHPVERVSFFEQNFFKKIGRADIVTTISRFSKQRFLESQRDVPEDRVKVIYCGINHDVFRVLNSEDVERFRRKHQLPENFVLFVGTLEPRKNLLYLLTAYERLPADHRTAFPLVLVGDEGWGNKALLERIDKLGRYVKRFGYIKSQADLALMYNAASVFVFPSLYEGFGIPPLEAMACGTPVCLSSIPVFHEIYGDKAAFYVDPFDPDSLSSALLRILEDCQYRVSLVQRGCDLSRKYTWEAASDGYTSVFKQIIAG